MVSRHLPGTLGRRLLAATLFLVTAAAMSAGSLSSQSGGPKPQKAKKEKAKKQKKPVAPPTLAQISTAELSAEEAAVHALNRLGFGPRPADLAKVNQVGIERYILQQLRPESIDDSALESRLERFPTLKMTSTELMREFPQPRQQPPQANNPPRLSREDLQRRIAEYLGLGPRVAGPSPEMPAGPGAGMNLFDMKIPARVTAELAMAKVTRATYSERQLKEVMVDFWFNHFNVFAGKGADRWLLTSYERDAIRPFALGRFGDLLRATAESPAMLFYLDNWMSVDPKSGERMDAMRRRNPNLPPARARGLNENYARELMELHTLGADGGYTQQDVVEVARAFTGWTIRQPRQRPEFLFDERIHDSHPKTVLGQTIAFGGKRDGEAILDLLARHPSTAKYVSMKMARRFVADEPPAALVEKMSRTFLDSDGDIAAVLKTMVYAPEFWSRSAHRSKIKKPLELVVSALRALDGEIDPAFPPMALTQTMQRLGEQLYGCQTPNGYPETAETWVNTGALLSRMNFAVALASGRLRGTKVALDPATTVDGAAARYLGIPLSTETRATIEKQLSSGSGEWNPALVAGLVLGSPDFQRR